MKTKAEALANPEAGDRWLRKKTHSMRTFSKIDDCGNSDWSIVYWNQNKNSTYAHVFRRWAAGAEYLGNEVER